MRILKLVFSRKGHYFREVKYLRPVGMFQVITDDGVLVFADKREIKDVDTMFKYIQSKRKEWIRDKKIEGLLD